MPDSLALVDRLRAEGHAAVVSGAGPSVLVLGRTRGARRPRSHPVGWTVAAAGGRCRGGRGPGRDA
jgi:homoserine kinase